MVKWILSLLTPETTRYPKTVYLLAHVPVLQAQNIVPNKVNQFLSLAIMRKKTGEYFSGNTSK